MSPVEPSSVAVTCSHTLNGWRQIKTEWLCQLHLYLESHVFRTVHASV